MAQQLADARPCQWPLPLGTLCRAAPGQGRSLLRPSQQQYFATDEEREVAESAAEATILTVSTEPATENDFGIFDVGAMNPTAAYIAGATFDGRSEDFSDTRKGYLQLHGQHLAEIKWDSDTLAYPPDDLRAVHVTASDDRGHGWVFVTSLVYCDPPSQCE